MTGLIMTVSVSLLFPDKIPFDWEQTRAINAETASATSTITGVGSDSDNVNESPVRGSEEKKISADVAPSPHHNTHARVLPTMAHEDAEKAADLADENDPHSPGLKSAFRLAVVASIILIFIMDFIVPIPMFLSHYTFSKGFFTFWVVLGFLWVFASSFISVILPIVETAGFFREVSTEMLADIKGGKGRQDDDE